MEAKGLVINNTIKNSQPLNSHATGKEVCLFIYLLVLKLFIGKFQIYPKVEKII